MPPDEFTVFVTMPGTPDQWSARFPRPVTAGRAETCAIHLPHPLVSREHARISRTPAGEVLVEDLGSTNGTIAENTVLRRESLRAPGRAALLIGPFFVVVTTTVPLHDATLPLADAAPLRPSPPRSPAAGDAGGPPYAAGLSAREVEVLRQIAAGRTNAEIAGALVISPHTVARHVSNIFDKTAAANRAEAAAFAVQHGLTDSG